MSNFIKITTDVLDVANITNMVADPSTGAISVFIGTTRNDFEGKKVARLEYEAYIPMAEKKILELCEDIRSRWPTKIHNIAIHHRLGRVEPTQASVVIAITSAHRKESLDSVQYAIDKLKATVPIWKKEEYEEGEAAEWKENKECSWSKTAKALLRPEIEEPDKYSLDIDPKYVQITASNEEIERRIESFIQRKREEVNANNVLEFCSRHLVNDEPNEFSCARTDSTGLIRKRDSASHLRKSRADNSSHDAPVKSHSLRHGTDKNEKLPLGLEERVINLEEHICVKPVQREFYLRLKDIEDRVLYLEGISPEYFESFGNNAHKKYLNDVVDDSCEDKFPQNEANRRVYDNTSLENCESEIIENENNEYGVALSDSLCVINKRIQELQSKLKCATRPNIQNEGD